MELYSTFAAALLNGYLGAQRLLQRMNSRGHVRIDQGNTVRGVLFTATFCVPGNQNLRLTDRQASLNDLSCGVEYRTGIQKRQEHFCMSGR